MIEKTEVYTVEIRGSAFDNMKAWDYDDFDGTIVTESGQAEAYKAKAAAKVRFDQMCMNLQKGLNDMVDIETNDGANHLTVPSEMYFKLIYTQPDGLVREIEESEYIEGDEDMFKTRDGRFFMKGSKAIEQLIKDAAEAEYKIITNYWNPVENDKAHAPQGVELNEIDVPSINNVSVTATKIIG